MKVSPEGIKFIKYLQKENFLKGFFWRITHISIYENCVNNIIKIKLKQHQFDALVSVCFISRPKEFSKSLLVKYINERYHPQYIQDAFRKLNKPFRRVKIDWQLVWYRQKQMEYYFGNITNYKDIKKKKRK